MSLYKPAGRTNYSYAFELRGHRFSGSTGKANRRDAERVVQRLKEQARQDLDMQARFLTNGPMTLHIAASRYWTEVGEHLRNKVDTYRSVGWLLDHFGEQQLLNAITESMVAAMVVRRRADGVSNATVNRSTIEPLRAIMNRARKVWKVPVAEIDWRQHTLKEAQERIREASVDEEQRVLDAMRDDYRAPVKFAVLTGCRRAEIVGLTWSCVDFNGRTLTVVGKGDKTRIIPMTHAVFDLLQPLRGDHPDAVFSYLVQRTRRERQLVRGTRQPITMEGFKTAWRRYKEGSGVQNLRFHDLRHTAATRTLRHGNLKVVQKLLGHTDIATTAKYAHAMVDDVRAAMEAANSIQNSIQSQPEHVNALKTNKS